MQNIPSRYLAIAAALVLVFAILVFVEVRYTPASTTSEHHRKKPGAMDPVSPAQVERVKSMCRGDRGITGLRDIIDLLPPSACRGHIRRLQDTSRCVYTFHWPCSDGMLLEVTLTSGAIPHWDQAAIDSGDGPGDNSWGADIITAAPSADLVPPSVCSTLAPAANPSPR